MAGFEVTLHGRFWVTAEEWNDFVDCEHPDKMLDAYRKRCDLLNPLVNCPDP